MSSSPNTIIAPNLDRSKSYQNCRETDVPGYNDCPIFLLDVGKKKKSKNSISTNGNDVYASAKLQSVLPPPPIGLKRSKPAEKAKIQDESKNKKNDEISENKVDSTFTATDEDSSVENISRLLNELLDQSTSKLSTQEYQYYKKKLSAHIQTITRNDHYRNVIAHIFAMTSESEKTILLNNWVISEPIISSWFPSFRKLLDNRK